MRAGNGHTWLEQARAGAPILVCPRTEQLTLLVGATAVPESGGVMLLSLKPGQGMVPQGAKQSSTGGAGQGKVKAPAAHRAPLAEQA